MFDYKKHILHAPDAALPTPVTTKEQYLYAKVTGGDTSNLPTPVTTEEQYLYALAQSGGGDGDGGSASGGVNILDLYSDAPGKDSASVDLYLDAGLTEQCATYDEAVALIQDADIIKIHINGEVCFGTNIVTSLNSLVSTTFIYKLDKLLDGLLWAEYWA